MPTAPGDEFGDLVLLPFHFTDQRTTKPDDQEAINRRHPTRPLPGYAAYCAATDVLHAHALLISARGRRESMPQAHERLTYHSLL